MIPAIKIKFFGELGILNVMFDFIVVIDHPYITQPLQSTYTQTLETNPANHSQPIPRPPSPSHTNPANHSQPIPWPPSHSHPYRPAIAVAYVPAYRERIGITFVSLQAIFVVLLLVHGASLRPVHWFLFYFYWYMVHDASLRRFHWFLLCFYWWMVLACASHTYCFAAFLSIYFFLCMH